MPGVDFSRGGRYNDGRTIPMNMRFSAVEMRFQMKVQIIVDSCCDATDALRNVLGLSLASTFT